MEFNVNFNDLSKLASQALTKKTIVIRTSEPKLTFTSIKGKMSINSGAMELMDMKKGDNIVMFDFGKEFSEQSGFRFAIAKGYMKDGRMMGATVGQTNQFSYSGIWATGMFPDVPFDASTKSSEYLIEKGLLTSYNDGKRIKCDHLVSYDVVELKDGNNELVGEIPIDSDSDGNVITSIIYPLVHRIEREANIRDWGIDDDDDDNSEL
jgi:hypothetical protein